MDPGADTCPEAPPAPPPGEPPPPILGSWRHLYALVLVALAAMVGALTLLTQRFQ